MPLLRAPDGRLVVLGATSPTRHLPAGIRLDILADWLRTAGLPAPEREWRFAPPWRFRFDLAWPAERVALEVEGGVWLRGGGRHNRGAGFLGDVAKYNRAAELGWAVLRTTWAQVDTEFEPLVALVRQTMRARR